MAEAPLARIARDLSRSLRGLRFAEPVTHVYDPLAYAWAPHAAYIDRYGRGKKEVVLVGMNPGPWGMAQTGVPFGEIEHVRGWLEIEAPVDKPSPEHPKRPIEGFACGRSEVSGRRLWGLFAERFPSPDAFFERFFVANYCPLVFMEASGRNRTPDKLPAEERAALFERCDQALRSSVEALDPEWVIGVGGFAEGRARAALEGLDVRVGRVLHPSPASPAANRGWAAAAVSDFERLGIAI